MLVWLLWLVDIYVPMAKSIRAILNVVVVLATCPKLHSDSQRKIRASPIRTSGGALPLRHYGRPLLRQRPISGEFEEVHTLELF